MLCLTDLFPLVDDLRTFLASAIVSPDCISSKTMTEASLTSHRDAYKIAIPDGSLKIVLVVVQIEPSTYPLRLIGHTEMVFAPLLAV